MSPRSQYHFARNHIHSTLYHVIPRGLLSIIISSRTSSRSSTVAIRGAYRDPFLFLVRLWTIEGVEITGKPDTNDGVGEAEADRRRDWQRRHRRGVHNCTVGVYH